MATGAPQNTGTGIYVKVPENYQPIGLQLGPVKELAKGLKVNEFKNQANVNFEPAKNDPCNKASDEKLNQDLDTAPKDATFRYYTAVNQVTNVVDSVCTSTTTANTTTATNTPNVSDSTPAQPTPSVIESIRQTVAVIIDAVKNAFTRRQMVLGTQPRLN